MLFFYSARAFQRTNFSRVSTKTLQVFFRQLSTYEYSRYVWLIIDVLVNRFQFFGFGNLNEQLGLKLNANLDSKFFNFFHNFVLPKHSSEIRGLRSTKCSSETLENLLYFMHKKTHEDFFVFHFVQLYIFTLWTR